MQVVEHLARRLPGDVALDQVALRDQADPLVADDVGDALVTGDEVEHGVDQRGRHGEPKVFEHAPQRTTDASVSDPTGRPE